MSRPENHDPHADADPRRRTEPDRADMPEGLRRERKPPYGPRAGLSDESAEPTEAKK